MSSWQDHTVATCWVTCAELVEPVLTKGRDGEFDGGRFREDSFCADLVCNFVHHVGSGRMAQEGHATYVIKEALFPTGCEGLPMDVCLGI